MLNATDETSTPYILGVIPSRWGSSRFPGKPLHLIAGKPLIQHVWERCQECTKLDDVVVATDHEGIAECVQSFGGKAAMTRDDHPSGTDRIAEVAEQVPQATHLVNIQGDEPLIEPALIDQLAQSLVDDSSLSMATAANVIDDEAAIADPNVVKVVLNKGGQALYFSRSPIPYRRDTPADLQMLRHKGIYAYRRDFLTDFVSWPPSLLEQAEGLEQLRALEHGAAIQVILTEDDSIGVDTIEQAHDIERLLAQNIS